MSTWRPVVITCDHPGCKEQWVGSKEQGATSIRELCVANGWATKNYRDWCPKHEPVRKRRRSIWRLGAHAMVGEALDHGLLVRPSKCENCDASTSVVGHHDDYKYPIVVRWLCDSCHQAWHREYGAGANSFVEDDA